MGFIFTPEHIDQIIRGDKTQTRRIVKPGETFNDLSALYHAPDARPASVYTPSGRLKWQVGRTYAVSLGRGKPGVWWMSGHTTYYTAKEGVWHPNMWKGDSRKPEYLYEELVAKGCMPLRIRLTEIRCERLQAISENDAVAEGYQPGLTVIDGLVPNMATAWYRGLWNRINTRAGTRWDDNPQVWALTFAVAHA